MDQGDEGKEVDKTDNLNRVLPESNLGVQIDVKPIRSQKSLKLVFNIPYNTEKSLNVLHSKYFKYSKMDTVL